MNRKMRKMQRIIRKMTWYQRIELMDWMNAWYASYKAEQRLAYLEEYGEEE